MIIGIGLDLIEVDRVIKACEKESFLHRCYTVEEIKLFQKDIHKSAGNFAVKEAVAKMLGTGFNGLSLLDIEVLRNDFGKPYVNLYGRAKELAQMQGINKIHISITNTKEYANAVAIGES